MNDLKFETMAEYIVKAQNVVEENLVASLTKSVSQPGELTNNLIEDDLSRLAEIHSVIFRKYNDEIMPDIAINDEKNAYNLELDLLLPTIYEGAYIDLGGAGKSKRFSAALLVLGIEGSEVEFTFPAQNCTFICNPGDLVITPPYFSHRLHIKSVGKGTPSTLNLYTCMQY